MMGRNENIFDIVMQFFLSTICNSFIMVFIHSQISNSCVYHITLNYIWFTKLLYQQFLANIADSPLACVYVATELLSQFWCGCSSVHAAKPPRTKILGGLQFRLQRILSVPLDMAKLFS